MKISLTDFVDFVCKSGEPKLTHVKNIKARGKYDPRVDHYKMLRDAISEFHEKGSNDESILRSCIDNTTSDQKRTDYIAMTKSYRKFIGKKGCVVHPRLKKSWQYLELSLNINPELHLTLNDRTYILKLYFKSEKMSAKNAKLALFLMSNVFKEEVEKGSIVAILDVRSGKLFEAPNFKTDLQPLLKSEAVAFIELWNSL